MTKAILVLVIAYVVVMLALLSQVFEKPKG